MKTLLLVIEFISALGLIIGILLHSPKGEGMGGIGGHARMFNYQRDMEVGLNRVTAALAVIFVVCASILGLFY